ncbi:MAG: FAD-dependent oxidoreductase [Chitinophagaceae bacterium]|nr:FAD-dependent oxidoreductase [Chitinophagaceae bacterium]
MLQPWRTAKVIRIKDETSSTRSFWFEVPELKSFEFKPGQFVTLDLPINEKPSRRWRSYSIASWPNGSNVFELIIVKLEEGAGTNYLFNEVTPGVELKFRGAQGVFVLPTSLDKDVFLICTGTGIAPFRSMIHYIQDFDVPHKNIYLVFGCRTKNDLLYFDELTALQAELKGFYYMPTLSREDWEGRRGYVHSAYEEIINKKTAEDNLLLAADFYLCGWKNMIDEAKQRILSLGYEKKSIHQELYG